jgi:hypothetical protein
MPIGEPNRLPHGRPLSWRRRPYSVPSVPGGHHGRDRALAFWRRTITDANLRTRGPATRVSIVPVVKREQCFGEAPRACGEPAASSMHLAGDVQCMNGATQHNMRHRANGLVDDSSRSSSRRRQQCANRKPAVACGAQRVGAAWATESISADHRRDGEASEECIPALGG